MAVSYQFLPWVRRGLTVALGNPDNLGAQPLLPARASAPVGVTLAGPNAGTQINPLQMVLHGPGDVIGIDTRLVLRTDPKPHARNFEPNYLAIVDFDPPDFPWMLTPAQANADDRLRPWLVLVVLDRARTGVPKMPSNGPLPTIRITGADVKSELPGLGESWSWSHAQVVSKAVDNTGIQADLQHDPASNVSRLVCPRRLEPNKDYVACVVPAFEPGRLRGLGLAEANPAGMATLGPAWDTNVAADVLLPVYFHWEFSTGPAGDFESLARRLRTPSAYKNTPVGDALAEVGTAPMRVDDLLNGSTPGLEATMEGALVPLSYTPGAPPNGTQADSLAIIVNTPQENVVNPVGNGSTNAAGRRLEVKPPMVGAWHARKHQAAKTEFGKHWVADLNLNPRYRGAAGYGAEVVRQNQESFVDAAWDQIGTILDAEMRFNLTRLAIEAQRALKAKHFDVLAPERLLQVMGPALPRIEALAGDGTGFKIGGQTGSLGGQIDRSSLPAAMVDTALRRAISPARRSLRMASRLTRSLEALPTQTARYVGVMAQASKKPAAFSVNAFLPDGILSTKAFDTVNLGGAPGRELDLSASGLGRRFTVDQVKQITAAAGQSADLLKRSGVPELKIRTGQGVFTDLHVERFGLLAASAPTVQSTDWIVVSNSIQALGGRGVEGILIEARRESGRLQFSTVSLDARSGGVRLDKPVMRAFDRLRREIRTPDAGLPLAGIKLGNVRMADIRKFDTAGVFAALPVNALVSSPGAALLNFALNENFEFAGRPAAGRVLPTVSLTMPTVLRDRDVLQRYAVATRGTQNAWRDAYAVSRVVVKPVDFGMTGAAAIIRLRTQPEATLSARLASMVSVSNLAVNTTNEFVAAHLSLTDALARQRFMIPALFDRVMAWPKLPEALYERLAKYDKNAFMPGVDDIPQDLVMLVRVNQHFIDSFMAGANFEMNRELLWRGFPTDLRGTPFQRFWGRQLLGPAPAYPLIPLDDMQPMHLWGAQPLGNRVDPIAGDPDRVALLVRGQLLRRYPNTAVYAWKKTSGADTLLKDAAGQRPDGAVELPVFSGMIGEDITFFGFDIDHDQIEKWCFVLEEQMTEPRFGFDVAEPVTGQPGLKRRAVLLDTLVKLEANVAAPLYKNYNPYKALSWTNVDVQPGAFTSVANLVQVPNKPFASFPTLTTTPTAAEIAKALLQQPFRAYFIGSDLKT
ncbi:hypothetical protein C8R32_10183 [Nitrosospira sp. Nsp5]|uniref:Uncharacterized protein n=1 Tax=Nitrosospira multiformis TaxID=1231 RepID=A0ABY0TGS8_9PROT|nr:MULTISPECIES: hypothetical protein [Nitrosospira]PTR10556.1 hypothetical protein C8R32_10183 [Nitrosospira sp. Nsp5]SDQ80975.1 hypothetical protein SAMN05216402_2379 [Nitrosospira multiformis]